MKNVAIFGASGMTGVCAVEAALNLGMAYVFVGILNQIITFVLVCESTYNIFIIHFQGLKFELYFEIRNDCQKHSMIK